MEDDVPEVRPDSEESASGYDSSDLAEKTSSPAEPEPEEEEGGPIKPFLDHLEDLRWVLIRCVAALGVTMAACLGAAPQLMKILKWPLERSGVNVELTWLNPIGGFVAAMKIALYGGLVLSLPLILYFIAQYVLPALKTKERKYFVRAFSVGTGLFLAGVATCYFVILKISLKGIAAFNAWLGIKTLVWAADEYFAFVTLFLVGMGLSFEVPVLILSLVRMGIVSHETLVKGRVYFFIGNFVLCAFITPDVYSTFFMVIPVQILLEICIQISKHWERQKKSALANAAAAGKGFHAA